MLAMVRNRVSVVCACVALVGLLSACNPKDLYVSVTDRVYVPPPKPALEQPRVAEAKGEPPAPPTMAPPAPAFAPAPAPPEEVRVVEPPAPPPELPPAGASPLRESPPMVAAAPVPAPAPEPEMVSVPNVVGMTKDDAQAAISGARLGLGTITFQKDKTIPAGQVISQDPAAGARVPPGTPVHLVVSTGWPSEPGISLQDVYFDYDRFVIRNDAKSVLEANAVALKSDATRKILIEGYCDERGTGDYNLVLGEKRARAVKQYLRDLGIDGSRLQITSLGKEKPFCTEHNPTCWQSNRRAHFVSQ